MISDNISGTKLIEENRTGFLVSLIDSVSDAIFSFDNNSKITFWNKGAELLYGWTAVEAIGQNSATLLRSEASDETSAQVIEENQNIFEAIHYTKDNRRIIVESNVIPMKDKDGGILHYVTVNRDITERKKNEELLKKTLRQLEFHIINTPLAYIEFNSNYQITRWSQNAEKVFGWYADEVLGKRIGEFKWVYEDDIRRVAEISAKMLEQKNTSNVHTNRNYRKDGSVIICQWYNSALMDDNGNLASVFSLVLDITELTTILQNLERSNKDLEQFAYVASHDLQEPLRMISTFTALLKIQFTDKMDDKAREYMDIILDGSKRMSALINDLLNYSRIIDNRSAFIVVDPNRILQEVIKDLSTAILESRAVINIGELPLMKAHPIQIKQLFQNLIANAIKFRGEECPVVLISAEKNGKNIIFSIKDNGIGISSVYFQKIFTIFQRLHDREAYPGTGIGLSICKKIVEHHGGKIWVESEEGKGSTFFFSMPDNL